jgi:hypothetical protein
MSNPYPKWSLDTIILINMRVWLQKTQENFIGKWGFFSQKLAKKR